MGKSITKGWYYNTTKAKYEFGVYNSAGTVVDVFDEDGNVNVGGQSMAAAVTSGTTKSAVKISPTASVATTSINSHKLLDIGDETGTTAYGFGDVTKPTTGVMASFGRTTVATSTQTDTGMDVRVINKLTNTGVNTLQGMYIKAKNYAAGTVGKIIGLFVEVVSDGTVTNGGTGIKIGADGSAITDIELSNGAKIFAGAAANETAVYAAVGAIDATGSVYISTAGGIYIQVANAGADADWQKITSTHT